MKTVTPVVFAALLFVASATTAQIVRSPVAGVLRSARSSSGQVTPAPGAGEVHVVLRVCASGGGEDGMTEVNGGSFVLKRLREGSCREFPSGVVVENAITCTPDSGSTPQCEVTWIVTKRATTE